MPESNRRDANRTEENPRIDKARILKDRLEKKYAERNRERGDSRPQRSDSQLSTPGTRKPRLFSSPNPDAFGRMTEAFARYHGYPAVFDVDDHFLWRVACLELPGAGGDAVRPA